MNYSTMEKYDFIVCMMDTVMVDIESHYKDEVNTNPQNHIAENYGSRSVQNHGDQWLTVFIEDFKMLHISDYGRI